MIRFVETSALTGKIPMILSSESWWAELVVPGNAGLRPPGTGEPVTTPAGLPEPGLDAEFVGPEPEVSGLPTVPDPVEVDPVEVDPVVPFAVVETGVPKPLLLDDDPVCCPKNGGSTLIVAVPMLLSRIPSDATKLNVSVP